MMKTSPHLSHAPCPRIQTEQHHLGRSGLWALAEKERQQFFQSSTAYLFLGVFLIITLFVFFWVESWFSRNVADTRPMFEWMPILLIFLCASITMRLWSEEKRLGTLEFLLTLPTPLWAKVLGKYVACLQLLAIALMLTLPVPLSIHFAIIPLDWGILLGSYLATFLLGSSYLAIGLYASSRSENQMVCLILAVTIGGMFYLVGAPMLTDYVGTQAGDLMRLFGSGSRFESIARGVLDLRDLFYYLTLTGIFLILTYDRLNRESWASLPYKPLRQDLSLLSRMVLRYRSWQQQPWRHINSQVILLLWVLNLLMTHVWLYPVGRLLRFDLTEDQRYSLSSVTQKTLTQLQDPVLIRAYFSQKTHPLLAPLQGELQDILTEMSLLSPQQLNVEFVDPTKNAALEKEANQRYNIRPLPFRTSDRYQASVVSSYFHLLIKIGDQSQILSIRDLIDFKIPPGGTAEVALRNPEYDIVRAIRKSREDYQRGDSSFMHLSQPVELLAYISSDRLLPPTLRELKHEWLKSVKQWKKETLKNFRFRHIDPALPEMDNDVNDALRELELYPVSTNDQGEQAYFQLFMRKMPINNHNTPISKASTKVVPIPSSMSAESLNTVIFDTARQFIPGHGMRIAMLTPTVPETAERSEPSSGILSFEVLRQALGLSYQVQFIDHPQALSDSLFDAVIVAAPRNWQRDSVEALDQFLRRGNTVILLSSPNHVKLTQFNLSVQRVNSGLEDWLTTLGISIKPEMVLDTNNTAFPTMVQRQLSNGFQVQQMLLAPYPYFTVIRHSGYALAPVAVGLGDVVVPWASPIVLKNLEKHPTLRVQPLLYSGAHSWLDQSLNIVPILTQEGHSGFIPKGTQEARLLAFMLEGYFPRFPPPNASPTSPSISPAYVMPSAVQQIAEGRLVLIASNEFASDGTLNLQTLASGQEFRQPVQYILNVLDWAIGDRELMSIRGRSLFGRLLPSLNETQRRAIEWGNYAFAICGLLILWIIAYVRMRWRQRQYRIALTALSNQQESV